MRRRNGRGSTAASVLPVLILLALHLAAGSAAAQSAPPVPVPFACTGEAFTVRSPNVTTPYTGAGPAQLYRIDQSGSPFGFIPIGGAAQLDIPAGLDPFNPTGGVTDIELNNLGFRSTNGMLYAMALKLFVESSSSEMGNYGIVKIDSTGTVFPVALPAPTIPSIGNNIYRLPAGDITPDGTTMYINTLITTGIAANPNYAAGVSDSLFIVDLAKLDVDPTDTTAVSRQLKSNPYGFTQVNVADWAVNPLDGMLYGAENYSSSAARIWKLDPGTGIMTTLSGSGAIGLPGDPNSPADPKLAYGGAWFDGEGNLFLYRNEGKIYKIDLDGGAAIGSCTSNCPVILNTQPLGPSSNYNDAAACVAGDLTLEKTVYSGWDNGASAPGGELVAGANGTEVTYVFKVTNTGGTYLDAITIADSDLGINETDLTLLSGTLPLPLAPGESVIYYYQTTISGNLLNTATASGNPVDSQGTDIPGLTDPTDDDTAEVQEVILTGRINVLKLTDGSVNSSENWTFTLHTGPNAVSGAGTGDSGFLATSIQSDSTLADFDGVLDFNNLDLDTAGTYTLCELRLPAGWSSQWKIDTGNDGVADTEVYPYNPNQSDNLPEDIGNRCFDFGAGASYSLTVDGTLVFEVNNIRPLNPDGQTRTPGYWKNWNTCSVGNQQNTAAKNGGPAEGWYLLDDILNDPGISWGDFTITTCAEGVNILDQRDLNSGKKMAKDGAYTLAMHLLAAQLNFAAGAETCTEATDAAGAAETLLIAIGFDGTGNYLRPKDAEYQTALELAETLDSYNNGELCQ